MVAPVAFAPRRQQAPEAVGTAKNSSTTTTSTALWVLGLFTASGGITVAVCVPPPGLHKNAYFLTISCFFFAGVGGVMSAVVCMATTTHLRHRHATSWRKVMHVLHAQLASVGAAFSTTTALGVLGLVAASTAITVAVCVPPPALYKSAYLLAISCFFFAGVGGVMSAVCVATTTHLRHRYATNWRKVMHVLHAQLASVGAAFSTTTALGVIGLAAASTAIIVAVCVPPPPPLPALHKNAYFLAISCFFFAGVAGVMSAVSMATTTHLRHRHATGRKLMYVLLARLASVVGAAFSTTTTLGVLGLAAASTAMNLQSVCQPPRDLDESDYYYHLAITAVFFAGVAGFMAAVREGGQVAK